jgi:putative molybdopterin biosynthesis protein
MDLSAIRGHRSSLAPPLHDVAPEEALAAWLAELARHGALAARATEHCELVDAAGRITAEAVLARHADPIARCSAMDGIAVRAADVEQATDRHPVTLGPGQFSPVDTGQPIPAGFDAVIPREQLERSGDEARVHTTIAGGRHIRSAGENVAEGAAVLDAGRRLTAYDIALAAACGHTTLGVIARPRVVVVPTGDEIRPLGSELSAGEAIDANSLMLSILLREAGADVTVTPIVPDGEDTLEAQLLASCRTADLVLIIAGSAGGSRDKTATVLGRTGSVVVREVALRPAHPVILGRVGGVGVVGLPGYPMSTAFAFERFARPLLELVSGLSSVTAPVVVHVRLAASVVGRPDAEVQIPVTLLWGSDDLPEAHPGSRRGSALASLAHAHATVSVPAGCELLAAGEVVEAQLLPAPLAMRRSWAPAAT